MATYSPDLTELPETYIRKIFNRVDPTMDPTMKQVGGTHYKNMPIQPGEFIRKNNLGWYEGNAIKYICRHKQKGGIEDLHKAIHYLELAMREYPIVPLSTKEENTNEKHMIPRTLYGDASI